MAYTHVLLQNHLERQQRDRRKGRVRVGVTFGVASSIFAGATEWAKSTGRLVASWRGGGLEGAFATLGKTMEQSTLLRELTIRRLLPASPFDATELWKSLGEKEQRERIQQTSPAGPMQDAIERLATASPEASADFWSAERFKALLELADDVAEPLLFAWLEPFEVEEFQWCDAFAEIAPRVPMLFGGPSSGRATLEAAAAAGQRSAVLLSEGLIDGLEGGRTNGVDRHRPADSPMDLRAIVAAETPEAAALLEEALADPSAVSSQSSPYDSAAEAFLAKMLEAHPWTAGLFRPQGMPGFLMAGGRKATVDFLAPDLKIALEVDGPHHFDSMQYRRDRHKDLELQSRGYVVLRFLAEDVVREFERIREIIHRVIKEQSRAKV